MKNQNLISTRCGQIARRLNLKFYETESTVTNRIYTGSYGRGTAINGKSDLDLIFMLPDSCYRSYNRLVGNRQSALLQSCRNALLETFPTTKIKADGQIVAVSFADQMVFEIVPAFEQEDKSFIHPDTNDGGSWKITHPRLEINAIDRIDKQCAGNLKKLCKMARAWKKHKNVPIKGLLIDTLAYNFIQDCKYKQESFGYLNLISLDFFIFLSNLNQKQKFWLSPGANQIVKRIGFFEHKAKTAATLATHALKQTMENRESSAKKIWRMVYGSEFPVE